MAEPLNKLMMQPPANNFGPITPEQQQMIMAQAAQSGMSPIDWLLGAGLGGAGYAGMRAMLPHAERAILGRVTGHGAMPVLGMGAASGMISEDMRNKANTRMDAEGQPGGFYGGPVNRLMR